MKTINISAWDISSHLNLLKHRAVKNEIKVERTAWYTVRAQQDPLPTI